MCGRYTLTVNPTTGVEAMRDLYEGEIKIAPDFMELRPHYNVAPTRTMPIWRREGADLALVPARWGLVPAWRNALKGGPLLINARADTVAEKPAFRAAFKARRCLVPATGFFEWQVRADGKQPYYFELKEGGLMAFAGLWERWEGPEGAIESFTIVTDQPNPLMSPIHDRMPVILPREAYDAWLDPEQHDRALLVSLLAPYPAGELQVHPVSRRVGSVRNDDPALLEPLEEAS